MKEVVDDLRGIISKYTALFSNFSEEQLQQKPAPDKWSRKEVIGHLIDSGQNNLRRFIVGQYETTPPKIVYEQNFWVSTCDYSHMKGSDIINLWRLVNIQIVNVLSSMDEKNYQKTCDTSKQSTELKTLEWLATDYVKHLKHHINQVIPKSFDLSYP